MNFQVELLCVVQFTLHMNWWEQRWFESIFLTSLFWCLFNYSRRKWGIERAKKLKTIKYGLWSSIWLNSEDFFFHSHSLWKLEKMHIVPTREFQIWWLLIAQSPSLSSPPNECWQKNSSKTFYKDLASCQSYIQIDSAQEYLAHLTVLDRSTKFIKIKHQRPRALAVRYCEEIKIWETKWEPSNGTRIPVRRNG